MSERRRGGDAPDGAIDVGSHFDAVLDIGKTRTRLFVIDHAGAVVSRAECPSASRSDGPYPALDTQAVAEWAGQAIADLGPLRRGLASVCVSAHGAAFAAVAGGELAWPVPDYEFPGFADRPADWSTQIGSFDETQSPDLPHGLNAATQFDWLERHRAADFARGQLLPYAQYWGWWLTGQASSEVSSLGCHTHLWMPSRGEFSSLAQRRGWARRFAPLRRAWEVLGTVQPALAGRWGLPPGVRVHVGAHDSNACLARYLRSYPRMTLVSTGTWIVVMAPGAPPRPLDAQRDLLANVSIRHEPVPTGRFMGGREMERLCAGADPALANEADLQRLVERGVMALPGFEPQGGPFRSRAGRIVGDQGSVALSSLSAAQRATLAAMYSAQVTAWIVDRICGAAPLVVEGPFAGNAVYTDVLAALLPDSGVLTSSDALEGTARGAWMLTRWTEPDPTAPPVTPVRPAAHAARLRSLHGRWRALLPDAAPGDDQAATIHTTGNPT